MTQSAVILPGAPLPGATAAADINSAWASIISKFSGSTAPTLGPGVSGVLVEGQNWLDTSVTPNVWRVYDGSQFLPFATIDPTAHVFNVPSAWRNILSDNGGLEVWQRGAGNSSVFGVNASSTLYCADRWYLTTTANQVSTVFAVTGITNNSGHAAEIFRNNGQTGTGLMTFGFPLDTDEIIRLRGNKVALSFQTKADTNWSPASGTLNCNLYVGTGAVGKRGGGFAGETNVVATTVNLTPGGAQAYVTGVSAAVVPTNATQGEVQFTWTPTGTAGANDAVFLDDVQLEIGTFASPFERTPFEKMLAGCKRHYVKTFAYGTAPAQNAGLTGALATNTQSATASDVSWNWQFPVSMRINPAVTSYNPSASNANAWNQSASASITAVVDPDTNVSPDRVFIRTTATVAVVNSDIYIHAQSDAGI